MNSVRTAVALWFLLAIVVFNVRFDWQVRAANYAFVRSQVVRHQQGQPTLTINDAFRPMVSAAAREAALWFAVIAAAGAAASLAAARIDHHA
jgi:amino acid transporter